MNYLRKANYYETDQMGIIHHSNYIRWFEEARLDFMAKSGLSYEELESRGVIMPVTEISCKYLIPVHFNEEVEITTKVDYFNGVRATCSYELRKLKDGSLAATGESKHCFLDRVSGYPVSLQKRAADFLVRGQELWQSNS